MGDWYDPTSWDWDSVGRTLFGGMGSQPSDYRQANPYAQQVLDQYGKGIGQQAPQLDPTQQAQFRNAQMQQMGQLQGIASGQQQGAGELAAQRQVQNAIASQQAMARMARGGQNAGLAMRQGARNAAGIGLAGAGQSQQAALQDQMNAQGLLANVTGQGRQQDIGFAGSNAQLQAQQQALQQQYAQMLAQMGQGELGAQAAMFGAGQQNTGALGGLLGTLGAAGGKALFSDENLKTDIADAGDEVDEMLSALTAKRYRYKDERHGKGERVGVMAQDLAKSRAGSRVITPMAEGLALDINKAISAALASAARLHERVEKLEAA